MSHNVTIHDTTYILDKSNEFIKLNDSTHRYKDSNGHLIVKDNPVAVAGVFPFLRGSVDPTATEESKNEVVYVHRSKDSLKEATALFKDKPIVHHHTWVGIDGERNHADGHIGSRVYYKDGSIYGDLIIYNPDLIQAIESGACTQLSAGYNATVVKDSGVFENQSYTYSILYNSINHLGVVEQGRAGVKLSIRDGKEVIMDNKHARTHHQDDKRTHHNNTGGNRMYKRTDSKEEATKKEGFKTNQTYRKNPTRTQHTDQRGERREGGNSQQSYQLSQQSGLRFVFKDCINKMKRGEMDSNQMRQVMDGFQKKQYSLGKKQHELDSKLRELQDEQTKARARDRALREIQEFVPSWRAYDNSDANTQYSRLYTYLTKQRLPEGMDARSASLTAARQLSSKRTEGAPNKHLDSINARDTAKKVEIIDNLFNDNYHRFLDIKSRLRRA